METEKPVYTHVSSKGHLMRILGRIDSKVWPVVIAVQGNEDGDELARVVAEDLIETNGVRYTEIQKPVYTHISDQSELARIVGKVNLPNFPIVLAVKALDTDIESVRVTSEALVGSNNVKYTIRHPSEDWQMDEKIVCWDLAGDIEDRAHFALYKNGLVYVWADGRTSHTSDGEMIPFGFAKKADQ